MESRKPVAGITMMLIAAVTALPALAGFNATAPKKIRRIFTEMAFAEGRLITYNVFEPGPAGVQAFPVSSVPGTLVRFPDCHGLLRAVLDDSAAPSPSNSNIIPDQFVRQVFNVTLADCNTQPRSTAEALSRAVVKQAIGFVNAPGVPAPVEETGVPVEETQTADELWGPVPNTGVVDFYNGGNLSPQHIQATTISGFPVANVQQLNMRRPRIKPYSAGHVVYFVTYETKNLSQAGLVDKTVEDQWSESAFPGERDILILSYGRAPLPPNGSLPAGSLDSNGITNDNQAVLNVAGGAPFWNPGKYSPLWKMLCLDGGVSPAIGPGMPCGSVRYYQIGQPRSVREVGDTQLRLVHGIFQDINCPVLATDVNDDGVFADSASSREVVRFADIDRDGSGLPNDGLNDPNSSLK